MADFKALLLKPKKLVLYGVFGCLTTLVNVASYYLCYNIIGIPNVPSVIIAWFLAVSFAFVTNKLWVFDSKSRTADVLKHELFTFFGARIATGVLDVVIMFVTVDLLHWNSTAWKLISNIVVIILNYVASKLIVFRHPSGQEEESGPGQEQ